MLKVHTEEDSGSLQMSQSFFLPVLVMSKFKVNGWECGWRNNSALKVMDFTHGFGRRRILCPVRRSVFQ